MNIDGQLTDVDAPPNIIDVDEEDDFINDKGVVPRDLAYSNDEVLANDDDDDVVMLADVARGHSTNDGGDDRPPSRHIFTGCRGSSRCTTLLGTKSSWRRRRGSWEPLGPVLKLDETRDKASNPGLPQTLSSQIGISILTIGLILRTLPEPFKMLKIGQRARSFAGKDPGHLMSSKICRWRVLRLERRDVEAQGSRRQYANGCALHQGLDNGHGSKGQATGAHSRCPSCLRSFSHNIRSVVAAGGGGGDDESGTDEDVGEDEDVDGDEKSTDNAKISRKRLKPDNHGHGNGIENTRAGRMLAKFNTLAYMDLCNLDDKLDMEELIGLNQLILVISWSL
ncbi:hypothetical protein Tco_0836444 [Tanacetum coccineum]